VKRFLAFWILFASLTACSSGPEELPDCQIPGPAPEVGHPLIVPDMPVEASSTEESATYDLLGLLQLKRVRDTLDVNTEIAEENALALEARNEEVSELIECARYLNIWIQSQDDALKQEKQDHFIDNLWHRGAIVLIGVAVAL